VSSKINFASNVTFLQAADGDAAVGPKKFKIVAYTGAEIRQGWSREPVVIDLAGMTLPATVPIVMGHDYALGSILGQGVPSIQGGQLVVEGEILADSETARQVLALADRGYQWQASVGADVGRHLKYGEKEATSVNGQTVTGPVRIVRASTLRETSFVTLGADRSTAVSIAADAAEEIPMAVDATTKPADEVEVTPAVEATATVAVEPEQIPAVAADPSELLAKLDSLTKKVEKMEKLATTRDERPEAPKVHSATPVVPTAEIIEASFALQGNLPGLEKKYDAKVLEAAHKARREISLSEVLLQAAVVNGYDGSRRLNAANLRDVLKAAFEPGIKAAWATHDISNILSSTVNKFLLAGFDSVESAWRSISAVRSVSDFKAVSQYRLNGGFKFQKVANGGELKNAAANDEVRTIAAETYGIMTSVTRTDLLNDDLSALTAVPQRIGRGGALTLNDVFWTNFKDDSAFFTTAKGNKSASSATALGTTASLNNALKLYRKLRDRDGNPMATTPRILLVPVDLEITAAELMNSIQLIGGNTTVPSTNVFAGRYEVVSSTYLTDAADFYLLASPADLPVMEVAFLNGVQSPVVETAEADFNVLGVQMRGYFDFGVAKGEDLAGVKMDV
jgi:phage major head subunit gpT-like protein